MRNMRRLALCLLATLVLCNGCAIVSSKRTIEGNSEKHRITVLGVIPIWATEKPVEKDGK